MFEGQYVAEVGAFVAEVCGRGWAFVAEVVAKVVAEVAPALA